MAEYSCKNSLSFSLAPPKAVQKSSAQKKLVVYQAKLFQGRLFVQSCRALDFCTAFGGAKEKDSEFFEEYSAIVEDGGLGKTASLVLVAREKQNGRVVGYCRADHGDEELRIAQLKAQGAFGVSADLLSFEVVLLSEPLLTLLPAAPEVHSDHQRKGVGKLLIQAAETQAPVRRLKSMASALLFCSGEGDVEFPAYG
ncbi:hypothetical protein AK812_SmicGene20650 [Symbiodinium microadriaticum]|uniref:Uncharacterized protein n=1 Tax=Symbiodinium microadriaticum TaxID=2951 RepID=A0A1Q9DPF9_SYMMI|nr:hypothetical protein AK812_SmicGene20650 [Symbiodinium microadriaticum]